MKNDVKNDVRRRAFTPFTRSAAPPASPAVIPSTDRRAAWKSIDAAWPLGYLEIVGAINLGIDMAIPARLSRKLRESLGEESGDDLVTWMVKLEEWRSELQDLVDAWKVTTDSRFAALEARIDLRFSEQQRLMESGFSSLETRFERRFGDLIKWSFVFWCGAIAAVAMLAGALR